MKIKHEFDYEADWDEIADEFTANDSAFIQLLEIAEGLDDDGKWFINTLHDYIQEVNVEDD